MLKLPPIQRLNELFHYDSNTGELYWNLNGKLKLAGSFKNDKTITYRRVKIDYKSYYVHRIIYKIINPEWDEKDIIDHKNNITLANNKHDNLRVSNKSKNGQNRRKLKEGTSKYKGVHFRKDTNKWAATIRLPNGKKKGLGHYFNEYDAAKAYDYHATKYFGDAARLNFEKISQDPLQESESGAIYKT